MPHEQESLPGAMAAAAAPAPQRRGIPSSWKMQIAEMIKQPTTARPRTTSRRTRARLAQLPLYACPMPAPVPDARHSGPCLDTAEAQLKAAEVPLKKRPFDPSDYTHPYDLTSWVASLSQMQPGEPSDLDEDNDKYTFHRPLTFEEDSVCEALSTVSLVSSTELEAEFTSEGSTTDALAVMEPMETPRLLETTGDSPTDTPPRGSLEPLPPQEASEMQIAEMTKQPTTVRPRTTSRRPRACPPQLPVDPCCPVPVPDARYSGPSLDAAQAQLKATEVPLKKRPFDPSDYTHPHDLTSWVASLAQVQPCEPSDLDEDNDKYTLHQPYALPDLEPMETPRLLETPAGSPTETPPRGTLQSLEPLPPQEASEMQIAEMTKQPTTVRPRTTSRRPRACPPQLPVDPCCPVPVPDARYSGPSLDTAQAQLKAAEVPLKKRPFDPSDYTHPHDLTSWVASFSQVQPCEPSDLDEDNDKYALHRPYSVCEALSTMSLVSSTELEPECTSEGSTTDALPDLEPMETPRLLETTGDSPTDTPPRGPLQSLEPLPPQEASESDEDLPFYDLDS
ncbi:arginine-glutamic acid dipeptide repeats protein [Dermacentor silvarum]|uniref:arginine-glutamic acid dipeptide repeats protein n=1 Tax=Dermacentor silvarum TaxID=543639 RepID=UPI0021008244|nr:arginine-glutamic acid dipeptide repeats protein [Dermacentor silvarum]